MTALVAFALLGSVEFARVDLPGIVVDAPNPLSGERATNFRLHDMDADGASDLLLPTRCYFQRNGTFALSDSEFLPDYRERPRADVHNGKLFLQFANRLTSYTWQGEWVEGLNHEVSWPATVFEEPITSGTPTDPSDGLRFTRFLQDMDGDGAPELAVLNLEGVHVFKRSGQVVFRANTLDILPPPRVAAAPGFQRGGWMRDRSDFPARQLSCRVVVAGPHIDVFTERDDAAGRTRYVVTRHTVSDSGDFALLPEQAQSTGHAPVPTYMQPCRLNDDAMIDFAGVDWRLSEAAVTPVPLLTTSASLDGGQTITAIRTHGFRPQCSFIDIDGDGALDLIADAIPNVGRGIQESLVTRLTRRSLEHTVQVHLQSGGRFSESPSLVAHARIRLDAPPYKDGPQFRRYREGRAVDLTGDYDGDGRKDLLVHERADLLVVYRNEGTAFATTAMAVVPIEEGAAYAPVDVNGDERTDLVVHDAAPAMLRTSHVLLSREAAE